MWHTLYPIKNFPSISSSPPAPAPTPTPALSPRHAAFYARAAAPNDGARRLLHWSPEGAWEPVRAIDTAAVEKRDGAAPAPVAVHRVPVVDWAKGEDE